jgi:hypothetical protein
MVARIRIEVSHRKEAKLLAEGLSDPAVRAFVMIVGLLNPLGKVAARRIIEFVAAERPTTEP